MRTARAVASGYGTPDDEATIRALEEEAIALRAELRAYLPPYPEPTAPPAVIVPQRITARQAQLALLEAGLLDDVEAIIAALPRSTSASNGTAPRTLSAGARLRRWSRSRWV